MVWNLVLFITLRETIILVVLILLFGLRLRCGLAVRLTAVSVYCDTKISERKPNLKQKFLSCLSIILVLRISKNSYKYRKLNFLHFFFVD